MVEKTDPGHFWPSLYEPFRSFGQRVSDWLAPASEASGGDGAYVISMELPGVSEDDVEVTVADGVVTVRGEKSTEAERKGDTWYFSERQYGAFRRSFRLPQDVAQDAVSAKMADGVLTLTVPRVDSTPEPGARRIAIDRA